MILLCTHKKTLCRSGLVTQAGRLCLLMSGKVQHKQLLDKSATSISSVSILEVNRTKSSTYQKIQAYSRPEFRRSFPTSSNNT